MTLFDVSFNDNNAIIINDIISFVEYLPHEWDTIINDNFHFFAYLNIFQTKILQFIQTQIDNDVANVIITNIDNYYHIVYNNLNFLRIKFYRINFNNTDYSIRIPISQCLSIPAVNNINNHILNDFYNNLTSENNIVRRTNDYFIVSLQHYIYYLNVINNNIQSTNNSSIPIDIKQTLSDIIFEHNRDMTDSAFRAIMEKIAAL